MFFHLQQQLVENGRMLNPSPYSCISLNQKLDACILWSPHAIILFRDSDGGQKKIKIIIYYI